MKINVSVKPGRRFSAHPEQIRQRGGHCLKVSDPGGQASKHEQKEEHDPEKR
ncbi:MAG: hypothetical protein PHY78_10000 [Desulfobacterales bacterium]|nr:hypothetical protein [Desulfobacterales bacterium]